VGVSLEVLVATSPGAQPARPTTKEKTETTTRGSRVFFTPQG
jgi:hypothetical protein